MGWSKSSPVAMLGLDAVLRGTVSSHGYRVHEVCCRLFNPPSTSFFLFFLVEESIFPSNHKPKSFFLNQYCRPQQPLILIPNLQICPPTCSGNCRWSTASFMLSICDLFCFCRGNWDNSFGCLEQQKQKFYGLFSCLSAAVCE